MSTNSIYGFNSVSNQTSNLISSIYGTSNNVSNNYSSLMSAISNSYGVNTNETSTGLSSYLVNIKSASSDINSAIKTAQKSSTWNEVSYNSDSSSVSVSYTGKEKLDDMSIEVSAIAKGQVNEGKNLDSKDSSIRETSFSIETKDGTKKNFYVATGYSVSNADVQQKVADKINASKLGITATVEKNEKTGSSKLVLTGETGEENTFTVSGGLAEELGIDKTTQKSQDAVYSINSGESKKSSSNEIKLDKDTTLTLKNTTEKAANITYSKNQTKGINAAREFVNSYNALFDSAKKFDDLGSLKLQSKLVGLNTTYANGLKRIGVSTDENGYLKIDEEKMKEASENGTLEKFFTNEAGKSYGFVNRLDQIADKVNSDPSQFISNSAKEELSLGSSYSSFDSNYLGSTRVLKSYFNYISTSALFDALF